jgi:hypothetical protein
MTDIIAKQLVLVADVANLGHNWIGLITTLA